MRDHPMIEQIERTGFPDKEYCDWELEEKEEEQ